MVPQTSADCGYCELQYRLLLISFTVRVFLELRNKICMILLLLVLFCRFFLSSCVFSRPMIKNRPGRHSGLIVVPVLLLRWLCLRSAAPPKVRQPGGLRVRLPRVPGAPNAPDRPPSRRAALPTPAGARSACCETAVIGGSTAATHGGASFVRG